MRGALVALMRRRTVSSHRRAAWQMQLRDDEYSTPFEDDGGVLRLNSEGGKNTEDIWKRVAEPVLDENGKYNVVKIIEGWVNEKGKAVLRKDVNAIISRLLRRRMFYQAYRICKWMHEEAPCPVFESDALTRIYLTAHVGRLHEATMLLQELPCEHQNEVTYTLLLTGHTYVDEVNKAGELWKRMKSLNLVTSPHGYNNMMLMYERKHKFLTLHKLYTEMVLSGVQPDALTYSVLLRCRDRRKFDTANLEENAAAAMNTLQHETLSASQMIEIIKVYSYLGDTDGIMKMQARLQEQTRYSAVLIRAYGRAGAVQRAEAVFKMLDSPSYRDFTVLLQAYSQAGMVEKAEKLLSEMFNHGYKLHAAAYKPLVISCLSNDRLDMAVHLVKFALERRPMVDSSLEDVDGSPRTSLGSLYPCIQDILASYARTGDVMAAEQLVERIKDVSFVDARLYDALLKVYLNAY